MIEAAEFWNRAAAKYAKSPIADMDAYSYTLERTRSYLSSSDRVLEIGCGTASTALLLAESVEHITASDVSTNMIQIGAAKARDQGTSNVTLLTGDLFDSAIDNGPYDAVLAFNVLHLLKDTRAAVRRINALLKPGGTFISKTVCIAGSGAPLKFRVMKMVLPLMQWIGKAPYVNFMDVEELEDMISSEGFKIVESGTHPAPSRYIVAHKL